jgi:hypothetical protein
LGAGAAAGAFSGLAAAGGGGGDGDGFGAFSATGGFASSSAMMRRIDARISSIEGSWTFAGCVISDSKSSTPSHAFYHQASRDFSVPELQAGIFSRSPDLSPDQVLPDISRNPAPLQNTQASRPKIQIWPESLCCPLKRYVRATKDCKQHPSRVIQKTHS